LFFLHHLSKTGSERLLRLSSANCFSFMNAMRNKDGLTSLQCLGGGYILSILSVVVASLVEKIHSNSNDQQIHMLWLIPQLMLDGAGDAYAYMGQLNFFLSEAPVKFRSIAASVFCQLWHQGILLGVCYFPSSKR
jgi:dipeptide/tripeptide permease